MGTLDNFTADLSFDYYDDETNGPPLLITRVGFRRAQPPSLGVISFIHNLFAGFSPDFMTNRSSAISNAPSACLHLPTQSLEII